MERFVEITNTVSNNFEPKARSLYEIGIILSKVYELSNQIKWNTFDPFDNSDSFISIDRTTIERNIHEINTISVKGIYTVASKALEMSIIEIDMYNNFYLSGLDVNEQIGLEPVLAGRMRATTKYLIEITSQGLLLTKKQKIIEELNNIQDVSGKIIYLEKQLILFKQRSSFIDLNQFKELIKFIKLEIKNQKLNIKNFNHIKFNNNSELSTFISNVIKEELSHNIRYQEGYKNFWRDESCTQPKKEIEIQQYISTILKSSCEKVGIKISREPTCANGSIDINFTYLNFCVCLEVKKADHQEIESSIRNQLITYMNGERTDYGILLVLWYKSEYGFSYPSKFTSTEQLKNTLLEQIPNNYKIDIIIVDCSKPTSPSKIKS